MTAQTGQTSGTMGARGRLGANLSTGRKIGVIVTAMALAAVAVGAIAVTNLGSVYDQNQQLVTGALDPTIQLATGRDLLMQSRMAARDAALALDLASTKAAEAKMRQLDTETDSAMDGYLAAAADPAVVRQFQSDLKQYRQVRDTKLMPFAEANDYAGFINVNNTEIAPLVVKLIAGLDQARLAEERDADLQVAEARSTYNRARAMVLGLLAAAILLGLLLAWYVTRLVTGPLATVSAVLDAVAEGDLTRTAGITSRDEIGHMAQALDTANSRTREVVEAFTMTARNLATSADQLTASSTTIAGAADQVSGQATTASGAAEQVSANVQTVAASAEEMAASVNEIAHSTTEAAQVAGDAVASAKAASDTIVRLGESSQQVGSVVNLITSIAEQTNLLALNATIEAARAGDAGKGFAVVASEVKDLAQETAHATSDIAERINAIQNDITRAVTAISEVAGIIEKIDNYQATIAAAVDEQSVVTQTIGRNITEAAAGSEGIATTMVGVATAARTSAEGIDQAHQSIAELAQMSSQLQELTGRFRT